jgi:hypothetical protein
MPRNDPSEELVSAPITWNYLAGAVARDGATELLSPPN